jgi:hypothetical protein
MLNDKLGVSDTISIQIVKGTPKQEGERMSYSRWGGSTWYAFYNVNGCLSLWSDMDHTIDWEFEELKDITIQKLLEVYDCTEEDAKEAMTYIAQYMQHYKEDNEDGQESV